MTVFLDILGATIVFGILIIAVLNLMGNLNQANIEKTFTTNVQTNVTTVAGILEFDLVKAGYHTARPSIKLADSTQLQFREALTYGQYDSALIEYRIGAPMSGTKNPRDLYLVRSINGTSQNINLGVVYLRFTYFYEPDSLGTRYQMATPITTSNRLDSVRAIHVKMLLESPEPVYSAFSRDSSYQGVFWEKTITPKNLMKVIQ